MGLLPKRCEPFTLPQRQVLFVVYSLLSDASHVVSSAGRSHYRSAEGFGISFALQIFNCFITLPTQLPSTKPYSFDLTPHQAGVIRALRIAIKFGAEGFRQWWERDELNRRFPWYTHVGIGRKIFLVQELLDWAFPACEMPDPILTEAVQRELEEMDAEMAFHSVKVNWNWGGIRQHGGRKPRRKENR